MRLSQWQSLLRIINKKLAKPQKEIYMLKALSKLRAKMKSSQKGSIALEYVLVSTFALLVGMTLLGITSHILKEKIDTLSQTLDIDLGDYKLNPFDES